MTNPPSECAYGHSRLGFRLHSGTRWLCRECESERSRKYLARKPYDRSKSLRWAARNRDKVRAHGRVKDALKDGRLTKPTSCPRCGATDRMIQASHNDYSLSLDIEWLCSMCHAAKDAARRVAQT